MIAGGINSFSSNPSVQGLGLYTEVEAGLTTTIGLLSTTIKQKGEPSAIEQIVQNRQPNGNLTEEIKRIDLFESAYKVRFNRCSQRWISNLIIPAISIGPGTFFYENIRLVTEGTTSPAIALSIVAGLTAAMVIESTTLAIVNIVRLKETELEKRVKRMGGFKRKTRRTIAKMRNAEKNNS